MPGWVADSAGHRPPRLEAHLLLAARQWASVGSLLVKRKAPTLLAPHWEERLAHFYGPPRLPAATALRSVIQLAHLRSPCPPEVAPVQMLVPLLQLERRAHVHCQWWVAGLSQNARARHLKLMPVPKHAQPLPPELAVKTAEHFRKVPERAPPELDFELAAAPIAEPTGGPCCHMTKPAC